jgi:serine/threonine protein kinase
LIYCHQQSVFHRNIHPANVLVAGNCNDIQLTGFECVKDARQDGTAMTAELGKRDKRIIPPEELQPGQPINYRLYDVFQAGVLFFWILEDGRWPFESTWDYVTGNGSLPFSPPSDDRHERLNRLITEMLSLDAGKRPDPLPRVLNALQAFE